MPKTTMPPAPDAEAGLLLNRLLFEKKGDEFVHAFAAMVRAEGWIIGDEPLLQLLQAARSVRADMRIPDAHSWDGAGDDL